MFDELELGRRVASRIGNEQDGFGAWINPRLFEMRLSPVELMQDWNRDPHTRRDPYFDVDRPRHNPKPTATNPIFFPVQRKPPEPQTKRR